MKPTYALLVGLGALIALSAIATTARADILWPTTTHVYFNSFRGVPYNGSVSFTINCFGYTYTGWTDPMKKGGTYKMQNVFSTSATVPFYGAEIYNTYYLNYRHITYCTLHGQLTNGKKFDLNQYSNMPINLTSCVYSGFSRVCEARFKMPAGTVPN